jgi:hypothetical protein
LRAARRLRAATEREVRAAADDVNAVEQAIVDQARVRRAFGSDVRSALDRLEVVDSALSSQRQRRIRQAAASPPSYVTALLGPKPAQPGRAVRWQQGLVEIEDWRRSNPTLTEKDGQDPWNAALGPPVDGWNERKRRRLVANLRGVLRDVGIQQKDLEAAAVGNAPQNAESVAIMARSRQLPPHHLAGRGARAMGLRPPNQTRTR